MNAHKMVLTSKIVIKQKRAIKMKLQDEKKLKRKDKRSTLQLELLHGTDLALYIHFYHLQCKGTRLL